MMFYRNVYVNLDGTLRALPFDGKRDGLWMFDGQFFFLVAERVR